MSYRLAGGDITVLLPGDIESDAEYRLLQSDLLSQSPLDLLIAPHHGSKTSSTDAFVRRLRPKQVIFSAGYQHQFGHPHKSVTQRYVDLGSTVWNTAEQGAITFEWQSAGDFNRQVGASRCIAMVALRGGTEVIKGKRILP